MKKSDLLFVFSGFAVWRILLFVFAYLATKYIPLQSNFLGGGMQNYLSNPLMWGWINFDGEHYLSIAQMGYQPLTYFFFPIFPMMSKLVGNLIGGGFTNLAWSGLFISNIAFFMALVGVWKISAMEFGKKIARNAILLLLFFPTSYYFGSYYTESIFLALTVWSFYFIRRSQWVYGGVFAGFSTAARIVGVALLPAYLIEFWQTKKKNIWSIIGILLVPVGILIYMYYLNIKTGDPLNFFNTVSIFGPQRSSTFILLPQVFYRYFFKIIPGVDYSYFPNIFTTYLEIITGVIFLILTLVAFWKMRLSYAVYLFLGYIIPTLSGSFSSFPRYVLVLFPAFILMARYVDKLSKAFKIVVFTLLFVCLGLATGLFIRGYWIS